MRYARIHGENIQTNDKIVLTNNRKEKHTNKNHRKLAVLAKIDEGNGVIECVREKRQTETEKTYQ